jgi:hypothetical protein
MTATEPDAGVRVGVTGHRVLTDIDRIVAGVRSAVETIQRAHPGQRLTVVSALAEGADRLVVEEVLRTPGARLTAVLPFAPDDYAHDFGSAGSPSWLQFWDLLERAGEVHIGPPAASRGDAYAQAGEYVLTHSDVLLAIWDGQPRQGRGGTAEIVGRARAAGMPLVIVRAGNRRPGTTTPTSLGPSQGRVVVERLS